MPARFNTARALFEAFPTAQRDVGVDPLDVDPTALARDLVAKGKLYEAVALCAYLLPRRDAVIWGCRNLRAFRNDPRGMTTPSLKAAEDWVANSTEENKAAARDIGAAASDDEPSTWMARATGWTGGALSPAVPFPVPPQLAAVGVRVGLTIALHFLPPEERLARGRACVEDAIRLVEQGG